MSIASFLIAVESSRVLLVIIRHRSLTVILAGDICKELQSFNYISKAYMDGATTQLISFAALHLTVLLHYESQGLSLGLGLSKFKA